MFICLLQPSTPQERGERLTFLSKDWLLIDSSTHWGRWNTPCNHKAISLYNSWFHLFGLEKLRFFLHVQRRETLIYLPWEKNTWCWENWYVINYLWSSLERAGTLSHSTSKKGDQALKNHRYYIFNKSYFISLLKNRPKNLFYCNIWLFKIYRNGIFPVEILTTPNHKF